MDQHEFEEQFAAEMRRIRLNPFRLPGLAVGGTDWKAPLLTRMRALNPGATWEEVFPGLDMPEPDPQLAELIAGFDADPEAYWNGRDLDRALHREFHRVVLSSPNRDPRVDGYGYDRPRNPEVALRALRRLPDGAGWDAFRKALNA